MIEHCRTEELGLTTKTSDGMSALQPVPQLMTQNEVVRFLRIPEISAARNQHNVIEHLKRHRKLPRIRLCNKTLYPLGAILKWIESQTINGS
jgi:hypothetical protein